MRQGLKRDFRNIFISRDEYLRVCQKKGAFSLLYDCGSGSYTNWFLYNSEKRNRLFMVWVHQTNPCVLDFQTDEYLGVLREDRETQETNTLYKLCFQQYFNNLNKIIGGFRDDVNRITQLYTLENLKPPLAVCPNIYKL